MSDDFNLSSKQQEAWQTQIGPLPRGKRTEIAKKLTPKGEDISSWKTRLGAFFKGEAAALRAVFGHPDRLKIVAAALGREPTGLVALVAAARGVPDVDGPLDLRVPGFEDWGAIPVLSAFYAPPQRETRVHLPSRNLINSAAGGMVNLKDLVTYASMHAPPGGKTVVIVGSAGQGRTPLLKALTARVAEAGWEVERWVPGGVPPGGIVTARQIDQMGAGPRQRLLSEVAAAGATLLATTGEADGMLDLPAERVVCALADGDSSWAAGYLNHLKVLLSAKWSRKVDLDALQRWLEDDPYALGLGIRADTLGFLVRHVAEGEPVPIRRRKFLHLALRRWSAVLRSEGETEAALSLEFCGEVALTRASGMAARARTTTVPLKAMLREFAAALAEVEGRVGGTAAPPDSSGAIRLLDSLVEAGLLHRDGDSLRPAQDAVFVAALGREIAENLFDVSLIRAVVLNERWHPSLVAAAEELGDLSPILAAIEALPIATRCLAMPATTRLMVADVRASDGPALRVAFERAVWWWACWRADQRVATLSFGGPSRPDAPKVAEALIGGVAPLIALGMASRIHARELGEGYSVDGIVKAKQPRHLVDYLALMGRATPAADAASAALMLSAPFQADVVLDPKSWESFPGAWHQMSELPGGITREEYALWWRTVGAPRLTKEPDGDSRIAGTAPSWRLTWAMAQSGHGVEIWAGALLRRCDADDPRAPAAFAEAVAFTLCRGGTANLRGIQLVWSGVRLARRHHAMRAAVATALPRSPDEWSTLHEVVLWILTEIADDPLRTELWAIWADDQVRGRRNIPWKAFHAAGLADSPLIDWAIATMPASPRTRGVTADRLPTTGGGGGVAFQFFEPEDSPQALALDHLVATGGPATLRALMRAPHEWAAKSLQRMKREHPDDFRLLCIHAALAADDDARMGQLQAFSPRRGESDLWESVASTASTWGERVVRWCQVSVAREEGDSRWAEARMALQLLECVVEGPERGEAPFIEVFGRESAAGGEQVDAFGDEGPKDPVQDPKAVFREIHQELSADVDNVLASIGSVLGLAWKQGEAGLDEIVKGVFASVHLRPRILGGFHHPWWVMAWELLGKDYVIGKLVEGHQDRPNGEATDWRLDGMTRAMMFDQAVLPLAQHEVLGDAAVSVIARHIVGTRPDLMERALTDRPLGVGAQPNGATLALARRLAQASPNDLVGWLTPRLSPMTIPLRVAWWAAVVPALPMGDARERAVAEWLQALASAPSPRRHSRARGKN